MSVYAIGFPTNWQCIYIRRTGVSKRRQAKKGTKKKRGTVDGTRKARNAFNVQQRSQTQTQRPARSSGKWIQGYHAAGVPKKQRGLQNSQRAEVRPGDERRPRDRNRPSNLFVISAHGPRANRVPRCRCLEHRTALHGLETV